LQPGRVYWISNE